MDKQKKILIILIIIDVIILLTAVLLTINLIKINEKENSPKNEVENKIENTVENEVVNNVIENEVVEETENNEENVEEETHIHEDITVDPTQEIDRNAIEKQESDIETAINIAKEKWGEDSSVEFTFDHIDENENYVIYVRDIETTRQIDVYTINIQTGEIIQ